MFSGKQHLLFGITAAMVVSGSALAESTEDYIGSIFPTAAVYCPRNTAQANGQLLAISGNEALYSVLGTAYGGDGRSSFGLPDLRGRTLVGAGQGPGLFPKYVGQKGGLPEITLTTAEMPRHTHTGTMSASVSVSVSASTSQGDITTPGDGDYLASKKQGLFKYAPYIPASSVSPADTVPLGGVSIPNNVPVGQVSVSTTGGVDGQAYPIKLRAPLSVIQYCIVTKGLYPPHP